MLNLDISGTLAKTITPSKGIPEQEFTTLKTSMKKYVEMWLKERNSGGHAWSMDPYDKRVINQVEDIAAFAKAEKIQQWCG